MGRNRIKYVGPCGADKDRQALYRQLNEKGLAFVDELTRRVEIALDQQQATAVGKSSARDLALSLLEHCWDGGDLHERSADVA
jgi:hypothetical protein